MSVARAREFVARARAAGIIVHELDGCYSRGNGQSSAYEGWVNHHTATSYGFAPPILWTGRADLPPPLCNTAGNVDGSVTLVAAHPANHAGASGGWDTGPLPRTNVFNKYAWGHEIVYPGTQPMTDAQYRTAVIASKIGVDIWGYGDPNRIKFHQGTSITGKWDPGYASGRTIDIYAFRAAVQTPPAPPTPVMSEEDTVKFIQGDSTVAMPEGGVYGDAVFLAIFGRDGAIAKRIRVPNGNDPGFVLALKTGEGMAGSGEEADPYRPYRLPQSVVDAIPKIQ